MREEAWGQIEAAAISLAKGSKEAMGLAKLVYLFTGEHIQQDLGGSSWHSSFEDAVCAMYLARLAMATQGNSLGPEFDGRAAHGLLLWEFNTPKAGKEMEETRELVDRASNPVPPFILERMKNVEDGMGKVVSEFVIRNVRI